MKNTTCFALFCSVVPHHWPKKFLLLVFCSALWSLTNRLKITSFCCCCDLFYSVMPRDYEPSKRSVLFVLRSLLCYLVSFWKCLVLLPFFICLLLHSCSCCSVIISHILVIKYKLHWNMCTQQIARCRRGLFHSQTLIARNLPFVFLWYTPRAPVQ